jgi:hypothetical protein
MYISVFLWYYISMKRILITFISFFAAMTVFSQDMSFFKTEYMTTDGTFAERRAVLENVRNGGFTGIGDFYHEALQYFLLVIPNVKTSTERADAEISAIILCQGLAAEKYTAAAPELWQLAELYDASRAGNNGNVMQAALVAIGQVNGTDFVPHISQGLANFNAQIQITSGVENRTKIQTAVRGCISALEALKDIRGYRSVFFASIGTYEIPVKQMASNALPNIVEDPSDVLIEIIRDVSGDPNVKIAAYREIFRTKAPDSSKAKVASAALESGWSYSTPNRNFQGILRTMRKEAIGAIGVYGAADPSIYINLEKSYSNNFISRDPDNDEVAAALNALTALKTDEAVGLLYKFLLELNGRRRNGPWGNKERRYFEWIVGCIGKTGTQSSDVRYLLTTISSNANYTGQEQTMARNAMTSLGFR